MKKILSISLLIVFTLHGTIEESLPTLNTTLKDTKKILLMATIKVTDPNAQSFKFGPVTIHVVEQNMFTLPAQTSVNAASAQLRGGGGVDAATHTAAGPDLLDYLIKKYPHGTPTGTAVTSPSFALEDENPYMQYIIHAVGPVCSSPITDKQKEQLESAHYQSLQEADKLKLNSIAFSAISSGIYGCPTNLVAEMAAQAVKNFLKNYPQTSIKDIYFTLYGDPDPNKTKQKAATYKQVFKKAFSSI